jgi:hypothetical protein
MQYVLNRSTCLHAILLGFAFLAVDASFSSAAETMVVEVEETAGIRRFQYPVAVQLTLKEPVPNETDFRLLLDDKPVLVTSTKWYWMVNVSSVRRDGCVALSTC